MYSIHLLFSWVRWGQLKDSGIILPVLQLQRKQTSRLKPACSTAGFSLCFWRHGQEMAEHATRVLFPFLFLVCYWICDKNKYITETSEQFTQIICFSSSNTQTAKICSVEPSNESSLFPNVVSQATLAFPRHCGLAASAPLAALHVRVN